MYDIGYATTKDGVIVTVVSPEDDVKIEWKGGAPVRYLGNSRFGEANEKVYFRLTSEADDSGWVQVLPREPIRAARNNSYGMRVGV